MRTLLLLRHARARRSSPTGRDRDRPLDERGRDDAIRAGRHLADERLVPDLVLASTAERAADTARLAAEAGGFADRVRLLAELYETGPDACVELLRDHGPGHDRLLLVGHQPTLGELLALLTGREVALSTGALATVELPLDGWEQVGRGAGLPAGVWRPGDTG